MPTTATIDLAAAVEQARRKPVAPRMPPVPLALRARTSPELRRLVPRRAALVLAERKAERRWRRRHERERAIATTETILAHTGRAGEITELARLRLIEEEANRSIFWARWRLARVTEASAQRVRDVLASGRPMLFSGCHLGPYFQQFSALPSLGASTIVVSGPWFFEDPPADLWGRRLARWARGVAWCGVRLIPSAGSFEPVQALLELGEPVGTYFDVPGSVRTQFLGKDVDLASGTAQLAHQTGALVVPMRTRREGTYVWTDLLEPLDARDFQAPLELHDALAAVHERSILAAPHTLEDPARPGSWEGGASASAWVRPQHR